MPKTKAIINIQNVVAIATLNQKIDLNAVVKGYPEAEYRPDRFPGLVFRLKRPKTGTLIFARVKWFVQEQNRERNPAAQS